MLSLLDPSVSLLLGLALFAALAGVGAWVTAKLIAHRQQLQAETAGPSARSWGGRDHERVRTKYFEKERRARAQRARTRRTNPKRDEAGGDTPGRDEAREPLPEERRHRATLGLDGAPTPEAVRSAYKARVREYHPDQVARLGVKLRVLAEEETKRINEAYAYFRERYGF